MDLLLDTGVVPQDAAILAPLPTWGQLYVNLRAARIHGEVRRVELLARNLLPSPQVPEIYRGWVFFYLGEGLREGGYHKGAQQAYTSARQLAPGGDALAWTADHARADLYFVAGNYSQATKLCDGLLTHAIVAPAGRNLLAEALATRKFGQVCLEQGRLEEAAEWFERGASTVQLTKQPYAIVEALNSLAEAGICLNTEHALRCLKRARVLGESIGARLELGKNACLHAEWWLAQRQPYRAEVEARHALETLLVVGYASGIARARATLARALFTQGASNTREAATLAAQALQYYTREGIYPARKLKTRQLLEDHGCSPSP